MKLETIVAVLSLLGTATARTRLRLVKVDDVEYDWDYSIRGSVDSEPIVGDWTTPDLICGRHHPHAVKEPPEILEIFPGQTVGLFFVNTYPIDPIRYPPTPDDFIEELYRGPLSLYLSKVDHSNYDSETGRNWFKILHEGFTYQNDYQGTWVTDKIRNGGWYYFKLPLCLARGSYLLRTELLSLHNSGHWSGVEFFVSCVQLYYSSNGNWNPSSGIIIPDGLNPADPGYNVRLNAPGDAPSLPGRPPSARYTPPGPAPITCPTTTLRTTTKSTTTSRTTTTKSTTTSRTTTTRTTTTSRTATAPTTSTTLPTTLTTTSPTTTAPPTTTVPATSTKPATTAWNAGVPEWKQCGGENFIGYTVCLPGLECFVHNRFYSQCLKPGFVFPSVTA